MTKTFHLRTIHAVTKQIGFLIIALSSLLFLFTRALADSQNPVQSPSSDFIKKQGFKTIESIPEFKSLDNHIVTDLPIQTELARTEAIYKNGYQLMARDFFEVRGRVLSKRIYLGDERADIAPIDLALGWGKMSDLNFIQKIEFLQNNRFLYWHVKEFPMPRKELEASASNMHLIPENEQIEQKLKSIKRGQVISLSGYLVDVKAADGFVWATSRSRDDSGDGACEIIFVKAIEIRNE